MQLTYLARQPILDRDLAPVGYELLYRAGPEGGFGGAEEDSATMSVLGGALVEFGLESLVGAGRAFVNVSGSFLARGLHRSLDPDRVVLEIRDDAGSDVEPVVRKAARAGYALAIDDFAGTREAWAMLDLVHYAKLDLAILTARELEEHAGALRDRGVALAAEKVESREDLERCRALGFDLYQGFFFERPTVLARSTVSPDRLAAAQLLSELLRPDAEVADLAAVIGRDVALTYRVLKVVNSGLGGAGRRVESLPRAVGLLGLDRLRNLASLMTLTEVDAETPELMTTASVRARMCEVLARERGLDDGEAGGAFLVGLLSVLGGLLGAPLAGVARDLPLAPPVSEALVDRAGSLGEILEVVEAYERDDLGRMLVSGFAPESLTRAYLEAVSWSLDVRRSLAGSGS